MSRVFISQCVDAEPYEWVIHMVLDAWQTKEAVSLRWCLIFDGTL